jgi:hypothetical protein
MTQFIKKTILWGTIALLAYLFVNEAVVFLFLKSNDGFILLHGIFSYFIIAVFISFVIFFSIPKLLFQGEKFRMFLKYLILNFFIYILYNFLFFIRLFTGMTNFCVPEFFEIKNVVELIYFSNFLVLVTSIIFIRISNQLKIIFLEKNDFIYTFVVLIMLLMVKNYVFHFISQIFNAVFY